MGRAMPHRGFRTAGEGRAARTGAAVAAGNKCLQGGGKKRILNSAAKQDPHFLRQGGPEDPAFLPIRQMARQRGGQDKEDKFFRENLPANDGAVNLLLHLSRAAPLT